MSDENLRRVPALMRERAKGAMWVDFAGRADWTGDVAALGLDEETDAHVAGMSPSFALAVADWLEAEFNHQFGPTAEAIDVARAYLGESA